jgi:hypothetical protein
VSITVRLIYALIEPRKLGMRRPPGCIIPSPALLNGRLVSDQLLIVATQQCCSTLLRVHWQPLADRLRGGIHGAIRNAANLGASMGEAAKDRNCPEFSIPVSWRLLD